MIDSIWNMMFNTMACLLPLTKYVMKEEFFMEVARPIMSNAGYVYYLIDSIWEIYSYNRYIYIPHHICCGYLFYIFKNHNYNYEELHYMIFVFSALEFTSLFLNIREHLKKINKLSVMLDIVLFLKYSYIRCYLFPYYSVTLFTYYHNLGPKIINILLLLMSYYWMYLWSKTLLKQINKKVCKLSTIL